jgi:hypothetical protein
LEKGSRVSATRPACSLARPRPTALHRESLVIRPRIVAWVKGAFEIYSSRDLDCVAQVNEVQEAQVNEVQEGQVMEVQEGRRKAAWSKDESAARRPWSLDLP